MSKRSYTLLEYLVCLENKVKALKEYVDGYNGVELEEINNQISNIQQQIPENLKSTLEDILERLGILESNQPKEQIYNLPVVNLNGDITNMNADVKVTLETELLDIYGKPIYTGKKCTLKWQGSSSLSYPKKNFSYALFENDGNTKFKPIMFDDVGKENKYHLKANYIDYTHARNIVVARLTKENYIKNLPGNARGCIDGFPVIVNINGEKQGVYTFNLSQTGQVYGLDKENPNHIMYRAEWNYPDHACGFRKLSTSNSDWEDRFPGTNTPENREKLNRLIAFVKDSDDVTFKSDFSQYMDLDYAIDYWIWCYFLGLTDSLARNMNIVTYDGLIWYPTFYDMDNCFGYGFSGVKPYTVKCPEEYQCTDSLLWEKLARVFKNEIKTRYNVLRANKMTKNYIYNKIKSFMNLIDYKEYQYDQNKWPGIMGREQDLNAIGTWLTGREGYCDGVFNAEEIINVESVRIEPSIETLSITQKQVEGDFKAGIIVTLDGTHSVVKQGGTGTGLAAFEVDTLIPSSSLTVDTTVCNNDSYSGVYTKAECLSTANTIYFAAVSGTYRPIVSVPISVASSVEMFNLYLKNNPLKIYVNKGDLLDHDSYAQEKPVVGTNEWINSEDATYKTLISVNENERYRIISDGNWCGLYTFDENKNYIELINNNQIKDQIVTIPQGVKYISIKVNNIGSYASILYKIDNDGNTIFVKREEYSIENVYESKSLLAILSPVTANNKNVTWSVNNENISIKSNGLECEITAAKVGESVVTVITENGEKKNTCVVTVSNK